ncbi:MAG TPA: Asp-tRNA(Asn)/Glu-tRNA(Gln) amidotransferase subunit GatA [Candidatus Saccharimonadales bacterium]|jgi:aspartyl-tRNA(Asn)/glutamyl-tRNA(Gln) amidotransferase subunit A|nr:Asp-tRNA(Asn)/Glu-tRNA(Gln) amidotransferase subunit GatA [Candidatus Saccharimonadales bacterium]
MSQWIDIDKLALDVSSGKISALSLVEKSLKTIKEKTDFNAVISTIEDRAIKRAKNIDAMIAKGENPGKLAGVPFIAKDNMLTFGSETTAASNILKGFVAPYQATVIEKLEAEGAICVAKANLDAFAHGSSTENSDFMVTKNPHNKKLVPGGSSGGSAAAVILDMVPFALGSDTGGSIRLPAAFCGAVGLKPTYGLVSRNGVIAMASSTDVIGPITKNVRDTAVILEIIAGKDPLDSTTIEIDSYKFKPTDYNLNGKTVGVIKELKNSSITSVVREKFNQTLEILKTNGVNIVEISLPLIEHSLACYYIICPAEVSSNLSRYDGIRYGFSDSKATSLDELYNQTRSIGFGKEAKRRIMLGTYVLSSGYYDAYYNQAQKLRTKLIEEYDDAFKKCDFILTPTSPDVAFEIGQNVHDTMKMYLTDVLTVGASLVGIPAISIPANVGNNLPIGIQIMADQKKDAELLNFSSKIEAKI